MIDLEREGMYKTGKKYVKRNRKKSTEGNINKKRKNVKKQQQEKT